MKLTMWAALAALTVLSGCGEPTKAAKSHGALNNSTPGKYESGDFEGDYNKSWGDDPASTGTASKAPADAAGSTATADKNSTATAG